MFIYSNNLINKFKKKTTLILSLLIRNLQCLKLSETPKIDSAIYP